MVAHGCRQRARCRRRRPPRRRRGAARASGRWPGAVEAALAGRRHLVVQAGTGTGKTLAYLVPAILSGRRTVVATATKALQDQLVGKDLPFLAAHLDHPFTYASLKGRANYLCLQRAKEVLGGGDGRRRAWRWRVSIRSPTGPLGASCSA